MNTKKLKLKQTALAIKNFTAFKRQPAEQTKSDKITKIKGKTKLAALRNKSQINESFQRLTRGK